MRHPFTLALAGAVLGLAGSAPAFDPRPEPVAPDGTRAVVDLPAAKHMKNVGGSDGSGLCVFTSIQHAAYWQNVRELDGFRAWMQRRPGGGWPQKVDQMFALFAREKGLSVPAYIQHTGGDDSFLELALKTDRVPCVTYAGRDDFYAGRIAHMVNLAHLDGKSAAIIDNNRPGVWVWMTRAEFLTRWRDMQGGWAICLLADPPPPTPEGAQAFGQNCAGGRRDAAPAPPDDGEGRWVPDESGREWGYWKGNRRVAAAFADGRVEGVNEYGIANGVPIDPPAALPPGVRAVATAPPPATNHGVSSDKIHSHPAYSINGAEVTKEEAHAILAGGDGLRDDSDRWHLTAVGDPAFLVRFRADVAALPVGVRAKLLVQGYGPADWPVAAYKLAGGVTLRKPSPVRTAADVGAIGADAYTAAKLADLLASEGGPNYVAPLPVAPPPKPVGPKIEPAPEVPAAPDAAPTPAAQGTFAALIVAALALFMALFRRK